MNLFSQVTILLFVLILWGKSLSYGFVWDDASTIVHNASLQEWATLFKSFVSDFWQLHDQSAQSGYYRPMVSFFYVLCAQVFGVKSWAFHALNLAVFAGTCLLFFQILTHFKVNASRACLLTLLFASHPILTEPICFVSALPDLLVLFFGLLSAYFLLQKQDICAVLFLSLALFSKESAIFYLPISYVYLFFFDRARLKQWAFVSGLSLFLYLGLHFYAAPMQAFTSLSVSIGQRFALISRVATMAMQWLILPINYTVVPDISVPSGWASGWFWLTMLLTLISFWVFKTLKIKTTSKTKIFVLLMLWFPYAQIIPTEGLLAQRYLYPLWLGVVGLMLILFSEHKFFKHVTTLMILILTYLSFVGQTVWKDNAHLWAHALKASPRSPIALNEMGNLAFENSDPSLALSFYEKALFERPMYRDASMNRVLTLVALKKEEAYSSMKAHVTFFPTDAGMYQVMADFLISQDKTEEALYFQEKAAKFAPNDWKILYKYALFLFENAKWDESAQIYEKLRHFSKTKVEAEAQLLKIIQIRQINANESK